MNNKIEKIVREHMKLPYTVVLRRDEEGDITARIKELEGCVADGQDEIEAIGHLHIAQELWLTAALKAGLPVPKPEVEEQELPSGKWLQRVPRSLHGKLSQIARQEGVSLNQLVLSVLAEAAGNKAALQDTEQRHSVVKALDATGYTPASTRGLSLVHFRRGEDTSSSNAALSSESINFAVEQIPESVRLNTPVGTSSKSFADMERSACGY